MTKLELKGSRRDVKGRLEQKYGDFANDDVKFAVGKEEELSGLLQQGFGREMDDPRDEIEHL